MGLAGLEPAWVLPRRILSPLRIPISPQARALHCNGLINAGDSDSRGRCIRDTPRANTPEVIQHQPPERRGHAYPCGFGVFRYVPSCCTLCISRRA